MARPFGIGNCDGVRVTVLHRIPAFVHGAVVGGRAVSQDQVINVSQSAHKLPFSVCAGTDAFFHALPARGEVVMPHDSAVGFGDREASNIIIMGDAGRRVRYTDQKVPGVIGGGGGECEIWNADHVSGLIVARSDPCDALRVFDGRDPAGLIGCSEPYRIL